MFWNLSMNESAKDWELIENYTQEKYVCGLAAGDLVRLKNELICRNSDGVITCHYKAGSIWNVIKGDNSRVVWLMNPDMERHTWDDSQEIFHVFEKYHS